MMSGDGGFAGTRGRHFREGHPGERLAHRGHESRGLERVAPVVPEEADHPAFGLEPEHVTFKYIRSMPSTANVTCGRGISALALPHSSGRQ